MKNVQMESKVRKHIDSIELPEVDVRKSVMSKINGSKEMKFMPLKSKLSIALLVCIFIGTCGFAVSKVITMKDSNGNVLWKANLDAEKDEIYKIMSDKLDDIKLLPGEWGLVYYKKGIGTERMTSREKPLEIKEYSKFNDNIGTVLSLPERFLDEYTFVDGIIYHNHENTIAKIAEEAKEHIDGDNPFYIKKFKAQGTIKGGRSIYEFGEKAFYVLIHDDFGDEIFHEKDFEVKEKVLVEDYEVLFYNVEGNQGIEWMKNDKLYKVHVTKGEIEKEQLIEITKEVMKLNK